MAGAYARARGDPQWLTGCQAAVAWRSPGRGWRAWLRAWRAREMPARPRSRAPSSMRHWAGASAASAGVEGRRRRGGAGVGPTGLGAGDQSQLCVHGNSLPRGCDSGTSDTSTPTRSGAFGTSGLRSPPWTHDSGWDSSRPTTGCGGTSPSPRGSAAARNALRRLRPRRRHRGARAGDRPARGVGLAPSTSATPSRRRWSTSTCTSGPRAAHHPGPRAGLGGRHRDLHRQRSAREPGHARGGAVDRPRPTCPRREECAPRELRYLARQHHRQPPRAAHGRSRPPARGTRPSGPACPTCSRSRPRPWPCWATSCPWASARPCPGRSTRTASTTPCGSTAWCRPTGCSSTSASRPWRGASATATCTCGPRTAPSWARPASRP